jgi:hypothetical protein
MIKHRRRGRMPAGMIVRIPAKIPESPAAVRVVVKKPLLRNREIMPSPTPRRRRGSVDGKLCFPFRDAHKRRPASPVRSREPGTIVTVIHRSVAQIVRARGPYRRDFVGGEQSVPDREMRFRALEACFLRPADALPAAPNAWAAFCARRAPRARRRPAGYYAP